MMEEKDLAKLSIRVWKIMVILSENRMMYKPGATHLKPFPAFGDLWDSLLSPQLSEAHFLV